jgi:hypothetical protein
MRSTYSLLFFLLLPFAVLPALPKVAVIDALISNQIDPSVVIPVTEKVVERLVASGEYLVLDRANVGAVLKEREFQFSGLVSDTEISQAGKYLGAEYVVVVRVDMVGETYFLSSRMIAVETGIIARQASAEGEGKLSVLLDLAGRVGGLLTNKGVSTAAAPAAAPMPGSVTAPAAGDRRMAASPAAPTPAPPPAAQPQPAARSAPVPAQPPSAQPVSTQPQNIGLRLYLGGSSGTHEYNGSIYETEGFDVYMMMFLGSPLGISMSGTYADGSAGGGIMSNNFDLGLTFALPIGPLMPWASAKAGYAFLDSSDHTGFEYGWDAGVDLKLGILAIGIRYQMQFTAYESATLPPIEATTSAMIVMVGLAM